MFKMLIVEDNAIFRRTLKETLQIRFPWVEISEAANAKHALRRIQAGPPNLIFMDIKLPGESGLELARTVRTGHPSVVIIFLTSYDLPEYREAARDLDVRYFLSKGTTTMDHIVKLIESLLPDHRIDVSGNDPA